MAYWYRTESGTPKPILLFLHGRGEIRGDHADQTTRHGPWAAKAENAPVADALTGFFRLAPHLMAGAWDAGTLTALVSQVREQHADASPAQLLVAGLSLGGRGALEFAGRDDVPAVAGVVACCPAGIGSLARTLDRGVPVYVFHAPDDGIVPLSPEVVAEYDRLAARPNFRWVRVRRAFALGEDHHDCWTHVFAHPGLYAWLARLVTEPGYGTNKAAWPDFGDISV